MEINSFPMEILFIIFNYLDFKCHLNCKRVCKLWNQLICQILNQNKYLLIHDTNHSRIQDRCGNFNLFGLYHYSHRIPMISLKSFNSYNIFRSEEYVRKTIGNFINLKVLYLCLFNVRDYQIDLLDWISTSCDSKLRHLSIVCRRSVRLSYKEVQTFCQKFPKLKAFHFEALELVVCSEALNYLLESLTELEVLILYDSIHGYERRVELCEHDYLPINFKNISQSIRTLKVAGILIPLATIQDMPSLSSLTNLHICDFQDIESVELISQKFPNLLSLTLSNSFIFGFPSEAFHLMESIAKLSKLKKLHLFIETENRIFTYKALSKLKDCSHLTTIQIESTTLNSECIEAIHRFVPQLRKLDLTYIEFEDDSASCISWIEKFRHLQCLKLSSIPELKESSVNSIIKVCNKLEYLDFSRSDELSDQTFMACIEAAKSRPQQKLTVYFPYRNKNFIQSIFSSAVPNNLNVKFPAVKYI